MKLYGTDIDINTFDNERLVSIAIFCNTCLERLKTNRSEWFRDFVSGILSSMCVADMIPHCFLNLDGTITVERT